jgi:hypothetical protein
MAQRAPGRKRARAYSTGRVRGLDVGLEPSP